MRYKKASGIILFFLVPLIFPGQNRKVDSIIRNLPAKHDTVKAEWLCHLSSYFEGNNPTRAIILTDSAYMYATKGGSKFWTGAALSSKGSCLCTAGKYDESIRCLIEGLKIFESIKASKAITNTYNSLANAYMGLDKDDKAYEYFMKAYNLAKERRDEGMVAVTCVGIGNILLDKFKFGEAVVYYKQAEEYFHKTNNLAYEAMALTMLGESYLRDSNYVEAEKYMRRVDPMFRKANDDYGLSLNLLNLGTIEMYKKNYSKAAEYFNESLRINMQRKAWDNIKSAAEHLGLAKEKLNQPAEALKFYKIYMQYKDSVINTERNKAIAEAESKYESEKKEQQLQLKNSELEKSQLKVSRRNSLIYVFAIASTVFVLLLFFVYKQFIEKKKANVLLQNKNEEIEKQKSLIEEKNKDITDSINYSKHIQQAIIPSAARVKQHLPQSFVIFKPKDIVSGDFYLVEEVVGLVYLAVVDCTGHGVPGAMLSVFAHSTIKNTIGSNDFRDNPAAILSDLCFQFKSNLQSHKTAITISDGVDMSICIIDKKLGKIYFAGAKNSLLMLRAKELTEFPANRWGISGTNSGEHLFFNNHVIDVQKGDKFYMSTDGFMDQFGGPKGKKFKQKQLRDLLVNYNDLHFDEQAQTLVNDFISWKGSLEQIDDVTLIGFEI
jgi:serine phosphatase RsbU (regulator of sigma subunit)